MQSRVLIVDDDTDLRQTLGVLFSNDGHACELAADAAAALELVERQTFDVVVTDVRMGAMSGLDLLDRIKRDYPTLPFIVITAAGAIDQAVDAMRRGAFEYMVKPCDARALSRVVAAALEGRQRSSEPLRRSRPTAPLATAEPASELIGAGPAMYALHTAIDRVAQSSAPVLIKGETGVGKELVAHAIHARSPRSDRPFVAVNTSAIPHDLLEGEIFGHVRGAFTGAVQPRKGLLTEADGGTLLLDEIGDMSFGLQAKLLRVLQSGDVRPLGSDRVHHVDVRILAATHRDLALLVKEGKFREDLYYRLNVLPLFVPPLRHRREDIPVLAAHFLAAACRRAPQSPVRSIGPDAMRALCKASWPGNVRELASAIERAVVFGINEEVDVEHHASVSRSATVDAPEGPWPFRHEAPWTLRRVSGAYTDWVLAGTGGHKERAAAILGIDLSTLYRWQRTRKG